MGEHYDRNQHLENWIARDGSHPPFGELSLKDVELLQPYIIDNVDPDETLVEDYTGNAGPTLEQIYRLGGLVIWPKDMTLKIVADGDINQAVSWVNTQRNHVDSKGMYHLISHLVNMWTKERTQYKTYNLPEMLKLLGETGFVDITQKFVDQSLIDYYDGHGSKPLADVMLLIAPEHAQTCLSKIVEQFIHLYPKDILSLMNLLNNKLPVQSQWYTVLRDMMHSITKNLHSALEHSTKLLECEEADRRLDNHYYSRSHADHNRKHHVDTTTICNLFKLLLSLNLYDESTEIITILKEFPKAVTPDRMLPDVLKNLNHIKSIRETKTYLRLWQQSTDYLLERSSAPPKQPTDWVIDGNEIPETHDHYQELQKFCRNPNAQVQRLSYKKELRRELINTIKLLQLDIDYATEHKGRPYALVCTKNRNSFQRRIKEYFEDQDYIKSLLSLVPSGENTDGQRVKKLEAALTAYPKEREIN